MTVPPAVRITDVALREGLQIQPRAVPTDTKLAILDGLLRAGIRRLEVGSFVHLGLVPQMADAHSTAPSPRRRWTTSSAPSSTWDWTR